MPKSKEFIESSDSGSDAESGAAAAAVTSKPSKSKTSTSNDAPSAKRAKTNDSTDGATASKTGPNGDRLYDIGRLRYVSVSEFKGKPYINIREYYDDRGVEKPGKKGISLTVDQWEKMKLLVGQVDKDLKKFK